MNAKLYFILTILSRLLLVFALITQFKIPSQVHAVTANASLKVSITESGLDPEVVTITVDSTVMWENLTDTTIHLIGSEPFLVYLPLIIRSVVSASTTGVTSLQKNLVSNLLDTWTDVEIPPGNSYTHTFSTAGNFQYYIIGKQIHTGKVVVQDVVSNLYDSVLYIENRSGSATAQDNPSLELGEGEFEDFTIEMFFYVSNLSYDGGALVDGLARKPDSYSMYIDFHDTQPDLIMFEITLMTVPFDIEYQLTVETDILVGWHHIAFIFDNEYSIDKDAATIYFDGNRIAHSPDPGNDSFDMPQILSNSRDLIFAGTFNGYIEEIRLSNTVRYSNTTYTVPTMPFSTDQYTHALWHFNETEGSTVFLDSSSYSNDLTGNGGAQTFDP